MLSRVYLREFTSGTNHRINLTCFCRCGKAGEQGGGWSEIEDTARNVLEVSEQLIDVGGFSIELGEPGTHLPKIGNKSRVIRKHMAHRIQGIPGRCVELCLFDQMRRDI